MLTPKVNFSSEFTAKSQNFGVILLTANSLMPRTGTCSLSVSLSVSVELPTNERSFFS